MQLDFLKDEIKQIPPEDLLARGIIKQANDGKSYICPFCGNGEGDTGDGLTPSFMGDAWIWHCFKCDAKFDNIKILADYYGLDNTRDFVEIIKRATDDFGISTGDRFTKNSNSKSPTNTAREKSATIAQDSKDAETKQKEIEVVRSDIKSARKNLEKFVESQGGTWRGLTFDTLDKYNCGFIDNWTPPLSRVNDKKRTPTPRIIIPAGVHYLARLTVPIDNFKNAFDFKFIQEKPHALQKHAFGIDFVTANAAKIFITEGEIDAMSLNQLYGGIYSAAVATLGAAVSKDIATEIFERLDAVFADSKKPNIIILFDDDDAGHKNAPKFCEEFIKRGYPAVTEFYKFTDGKKIDANSILVNSGADALRRATNELVRRNSDTFDKLRADIKQAQIKAAEIAENQRLQAERERLQAEKERKEKALRKIIFALPHSDQDNATRIFQMFGDIIRYNTENENWYTYKNGIWKQGSSANSTLYPYTRQLSNFIAANRPKVKAVQNSDGSISTDTSQKQPTPEQVEIGEKLADKWRQAKTQRNAIELLKGTEEILITQADLNNHNNLLNVKNGAIDLETGKFHHHDPQLLFTQQANVIYNPRATCPLFDKFMLDILPDEQTRAAVLRYLGYGLTGETNEEKILFVIGKGGNGKGTLFDTINCLLGSFATEFDIELLLRQKYPKDANTASPEIAKLEYIRLAYSPETPAGREFDLAKLKALTGGDTITARELYGRPKTYKPKFKLIVSGQHAIRVENPHDVGFLRRFLQVEFNQNFADNPDPHLKDKLRQAEELSGILNLLVAESVKWYNTIATDKTGLIVSAAMDKSKQEYISDNDFMANFINDFCELAPDYLVSRKDFLKRLKEEYPQAYRFKDSELVDMACKIEGISYDGKCTRAKNNATFLGVKLD